MIDKFSVGISKDASFVAGVGRDNSESAGGAGGVVDFGLATAVATGLGMGVGVFAGSKK